MRRVLFILFLCAHSIAWGQTGYEYRYWFDSDETTLQTGTANTAAWQMNLDVSALEETFHLLYLQVKDTADVWSSPRTHCFVKLPAGDMPLLTYWFNNEKDKVQILNMSNGIVGIDVSHLPDGMHLLHLEAAAPGCRHASVAKTALFWKCPIVRQMKYRMWVDDDSTMVQEGVYSGRPVELDVAAVSDGFHILRAQIEGGSASSPQTSMFIKVPQTAGVDYLTAVFLVDGKEYKQEKLSAAGGIVEWTFDASGIPHGLHKAQAMVVTPSGAATGVKDAFFYRAMTTAEKANMRCFYSIDGSPHQYEAGRMDNNLYHFDLNVAEATDGFHRLSYMLMGENGVSSKVMSAFFIKTPLGGNGVMQYDYWLNENEENMRKVKLEKRENPFKLISLLPVEPCPIRSSSFHFEVENGQPVIYAKNDFHVRFYDVAGRVTEASKSYVDYEVGQPVENAEVITEAEGVITCDKPEENGILWFKMDAKTGDSIAVRTSQAATLQIFSPSGREVYAASGAESVGFSGCHAYEDGTFYIALHDVKGTAGSAIDLHYQRIDKYAVLKWTPHEVGAAPGYIHIDLFGNGYDKLVGLKLVCGEEILRTDTIMVKDIANVTAEFYIYDTEIPRGQYDLILDFEENGIRESLTVERAVNITEPVYGYINIEQSSQRRTAKPYPVTVRITNTGNVSYQMIPVYIAFDRPELIEEFVPMNFGIALPADSIPSDSINADSISVSSTYVMTDNLLGKGIKAFVLPLMLPELSGGETVELQVGFVSGPHARFNLYTWNNTPWSVYSHPQADSIMAEMASASGVPNPLCGNSPCEMMHGIPDMASCLCGIMWGTVSSIAGSFAARMNIAYRERDGFFEGIHVGEPYESPYRRVALPTPRGILKGVIDQCANMPNWALQFVYDRFSDMIDDSCVEPKSHSVDVYMPGDPNDIKGYTAPSGSQYVAKDVTDLYYAIEFENDPKIANAAAHHIVIKDTLDGRYMDLSSFSPTGIKFGKREVVLDGEQSFIKTIDFRPETNVIAQLSLDYDVSKGIATWDFMALDPMSLEPTDHAMMGILPVNNESGDGQGEITFDIKLKGAVEDGVNIRNRAAIIFDQEAPIITPTWTNVVDTVAPASLVSACETVNDSTVTLHFKGEDNRSGVWTYDLYAQDYDSAPWTKIAESIADSIYTFKGFTGFNYRFCVVATDSAGNKEHKPLTPEWTKPTYKAGDANGDGVVNTTDAILAIDKYLGNTVYLNALATDVNADGIINTNDAMLIQEIYLTTVNKMRTKSLRRRLITKN